MGWTQPCCERCWINREVSWVQGEDGSLSPVIRRPALLLEPEIERCAFCAQPTIFGCYVRVDPKVVPFPKEESDD